MINSGLGRGLGSLIPNKQASVVSSNKDGKNFSEQSNGQALEVDINKIIANHLQPRKQFRDVKLEELCDSIKEHGIIQPLIVVKKDDGFELVAGERRLRASKMAGLKTVPVIIREASSDEKNLELAIIENIQREDLNAIDLAEAYASLMNQFHIGQDEVAKKVGKPRSSVANIMRMLKLPEEIRLALIDGKITEGHAKYLVGLDSEAKQMTLFRKILHSELTVSGTNEEVRKMGGTKNARVKVNYEDNDKEFLFREFFGAKAEVRRKGAGGEIIIHFFSDEELGEIIKKIK